MGVARRGFRGAFKQVPEEREGGSPRKNGENGPGNGAVNAGVLKTNHPQASLGVRLVLSPLGSLCRCSGFVVRDPSI